MAHEYSVLIHDWITEQKTRIESEKKRAKAQGDHARIQNLEGQTAQIQEMRQFLGENMDLENHIYYE